MASIRIRISHYQLAILIKLAFPSRGFGLDHNMPSHRSSLPELTRHHRSKYVCLFRPSIVAHRPLSSIRPIRNICL